jgi:hypothetical protein
MVSRRNSFLPLLAPAYTTQTEFRSRSTCEMSNKLGKLSYNVVSILGEDVLMTLDLIGVVD